MSASAPLSLESVRDSIERLLRVHAVHDERGISICEVAADLLSSRSTVQRALRAHGTTFSAELHQLRVRIATLLIVRHRRTATEAARAVGVTPDHLRKLLLDALGVTPGNLRRVLGKLDTVRRWNRGSPPQYGTPWYRQRRRRWMALERDVARILGPIPPSSPLREWADQRLDEIRRPDFRKNPHRDRIRRDRAEQQRIWVAQFEAILKRALAHDETGAAP